MSETLLRWIALAVAGVAVVIVVRHHLGYLRRSRRLGFTAFLETAGWIIVTLVAAAGYWGGLESAGTRRVEITAGIVGVLFIAAGSYRR